MFIRKAVKSVGVVYKLFSHGAVREGGTVGRFIAGFLPRSFYAEKSAYSFSLLAAVFGCSMLQDLLVIN